MGWHADTGLIEGCIWMKICGLDLFFSNPLRKDVCRRDDCMACITRGKWDCSNSGPGYKIKWDGERGMEGTRGIIILACERGMGGTWGLGREMWQGRGQEPVAELRI